MIQVSIILSIVILLGLSLTIFKKDDEYKYFLKVLTVIYLAIGFFRMFLSDSFIMGVDNSLTNIPVLQIILRWGYYTNYAILPMAVFSNNRVFKNIASYFSLTFTMLSIVFFNKYMGYFLSYAGEGIQLVPWFRYLYFGIELSLAAFIPIFGQIKEKYYFNVKDKKEWLNFGIVLLGVLVLMMPVYVPQHILGTSLEIPKAYSAYHFVWIFLIILQFYILHMIFKNRSEEDRFALILLLTIVLFFHYNNIYLRGIRIYRLPFQLCNIAAYLYLICIPLRLKRMFNFIFIVNFIGALIATVTPDFSADPFGFWNMHYIYEHTLVLIVPLLAMSLNIFPRLTKHSIKDIVIGYVSYFTFVLVIGTIINGYKEVTGATVNFFFLFNINKLSGWLPFMKNTEKFVITIGRFEIYPVFQMIIFIGYLGVCLMFYQIVTLVYKLKDHYFKTSSPKVATD